MTYISLDVPRSLARCTVPIACSYGRHWSVHSGSYAREGLSDGRRRALAGIHTLKIYVSLGNSPNNQASFAQSSV